MVKVSRNLKLDNFGWQNKSVSQPDRNIFKKVITFKFNKLFYVFVGITPTMILKKGQYQPSVK